MCSPPASHAHPLAACLALAALQVRIGVVSHTLLQMSSRNKQQQRQHAAGEPALAAADVVGWRGARDAGTGAAPPRSR